MRRVRRVSSRRVLVHVRVLVLMLMVVHLRPHARHGACCCQKPIVQLPS